MQSCNFFKSLNFAFFARFFIVQVLILPGMLFADVPQPGPLGFGKKSFSVEMETDRPDFTEGTQTIDPGHFQIESGYTYFKENAPGDQSDTSIISGSTNIEAHILPEALIRIGVLEDVELRLNWPGYAFEEDGGSGVTDFSAGYKQNIFFQEDYIPNLSYIFEMVIPAGSDQQTADSLEPAVKLLWDYSLTDTLSVAGNLNLASRNADSSRFIETAASGTLGYGLTDNIGVYAEYFGIYPDTEKEDNSDQHYINGGCTYALNENLQLDIRAGLGLNKAAADMFSGIGLSFRI